MMPGNRLARLAFAVVAIVLVLSLILSAAPQF